MENQQCVGKTAYTTKAKALDRLSKHMGNRARVKRKNWCGHSRMTAYQCRSCGHWHVGANAVPPKPAPKRVFRLTPGALDV